MNRYSVISLIDSDPRRTAQRMLVLRGSRFHVEPFQDVEDFRLRGATETLILLHDEGLALDTLLADMREREYWAPVLGYGRMVDPVFVSEVILIGLVGYLPTAFLLRDFNGLLKATAEQLTALINLRHGAAEARRKLGSLTDRELQVLDHLQFGQSNQSIAEHFGISVRTVETHRLNLLRKLEVKSVVTAARMRLLASIGI